MHHSLHVALQDFAMLDCEKLHANQLSCAALHVCSKHVCLHGSHCIVTLDGLTWRTALCLLLCVTAGHDMQLRPCCHTALQPWHLQLVSDSNLSPATSCLLKKSAELLAHLLQTVLHQCIQTVQLWYGLQRLLSLSTVPYISKRCI